MTDAPKEPPTSAQALIGPDYKESTTSNDPTAYRKVADPRYMVALQQQKAATATMTPRRRPLLRLVWINPNLPAKDYE